MNYLLVAGLLIINRVCAQEKLSKYAENILPIQQEKDALTSHIADLTKAKT